MKLRYYTAVTTGILALIATMVILWFLTQLEVQEIAFLATLSFWAGVAVVLLATERKDKHDRT